MREACIILPTGETDEFANAHLQLRDRLLREFGGFTRAYVTGAWRDPKTGKTYADQSWSYTIAMAETIQNRLALRDICAEAGTLAGQISVYMRWTDGEIEFVNCDPEDLTEFTKELEALIG